MIIAADLRCVDRVETAVCTACSQHANELVNALARTGWLILLIYPVGIPCLFFVLTWRSRHKLNPDALYVIADVTCAGALTDDSVPVTGEMQHLATSIVSIHGAAADVEQKAIERHARAARLASEDSQRAIERGVDRSSSVRESLADHATKMQDAVPKKWEDYLPERAAVVIQLRASAAVTEAELIHQYRSANPSVQILSFLIGAYEVIAHQLLIVRSDLT